METILLKSEIQQLYTFKANSTKNNEDTSLFDYKYDSTSEITHNFFQTSSDLSKTEPTDIQRKKPWMLKQLLL